MPATARPSPAGARRRLLAAGLLAIVAATAPAAAAAALPAPPSPGGTLAGAGAALGLVPSSALTLTPVAPSTRSAAAGLALDPALTVAQPGDSPATAAARAALARHAAAVEAAGQAYDKAVADAQAARAALGAARARAAAAAAAYTTASADLGQYAAQAYMDGGATGSLAAMLVSGNPADVLDRASLLQQVGNAQSAAVLRADRAQAAMRAAQAHVASLVAQAQAALARADAARTQAQADLLAAQNLVVQAQLADDSALAARLAAGTGPGSATDAATALRAQAVASGAADAAAFTGLDSPAATISVAVHALLRQAAGHGPHPRGTGAFTPVGQVPADVQAVMGPAPALGGLAPAGAGTPAAAGAAAAAAPSSTATTAALARFTAAVPTPGAAGVGLAGAAPLLPADGVSVHPRLPAATGPQTRAEVAVDAALAQLGSPYVWAAAGPTTFDCSGLTQWAWGHAGVALAHYTVTQFGQGAPVSPGQLLPGDLVFFGADLHHVGMYLGAGFMIDAPHTGAYVRIERVASWGDYVGAVRP